MRRTEARQGARMVMFLNILHRFESAELNQEEAAELLGVSERTFRRWTRRYEEDGEAGLLDRRLGHASGKRVPIDRAEEVERLYREPYQGLYRQALPRASGQGPRLRLMATRERSCICNGRASCQRRRARGASQEARAAAVAGHAAASGRLTPCLASGPAGARPDRDHGRCDRDDLLGVPGRRGGHGLDFPGAEGGVLETRAGDEPLHRPRRALFFTPEAGGAVDRNCLTQVGRALKQLGVEHIGAYSPQARGRSERMFGTLQDRLVNELRLAGITGVEEANAFIRDVYLPAHNARFAVAPAGEGSAFTPIPGVDLDDILCVHEERQVGNDNCVSFRTLKLQIPESPMRRHFVKARVKVHVYPDGSHAVFHGLRCIGRYDEKGKLEETRRLTPLSGDRPVDMWTTLRLAHRRTEAEEADS